MKLPLPAFRFRLLGSLLLLLGALGSWRAADDALLTRLLSRLQTYYATARPEVSYLHLDQAAYAAGETLWFKAYVVDAYAHRRDSLSRVLYVDVVAPNQRAVVFRRTLRLQAGMATGDVVLPDTLTPGIYTIRAYTSWMRNSDEGLFFSRRVPIWQASAPAQVAPASTTRQNTLAKQQNRQQQAATRPDVQFFPEGGDYVAGLQTVVGVKAADASGHGLPVQGVVLDDQNREILRFTTPALGMSSFGMIPAAGGRYRARVTLPGNIEEEYPLPAVKTTGWVMNVREIGANYLVFVRSQPEAGATGPETVRVLGQINGLPVYAGAGPLVAGQTFSAVIPKATLPGGLLHITVFDEKPAPRAQRLLFVPDPAPLRVMLRPDKAEYGPRELVTLDVDVQTAAGAPVPAELSVAVANLAGLPATAASDATIESHLLLTSELRGYVETPGYYFQNPTPATRKALDDLLLTQGWSRFTWPDLLAETPNLLQSYAFPAEQDLTLSGRLVRPNGKPVPNGGLMLLEKRNRELVPHAANEQGYFLFSGFPGTDTTHLILQARTEKGSNNVLIKLNNWWPLPTQPRPLPLLPAAAAAPAEVAAYGRSSRRQQLLERQYRPDSISGILLGNVTIRGRQAPMQDPRSIHGTPSNTLSVSSIPYAGGYRTVLDLIQGRIPGVQVSHSGFDYQVLIRGATSINGNTTPLFVLDGMVVSSIDVITSIPVSDIDRVEVLKGASAAIYGSRGSNGVIAVFTKVAGPTQTYSEVPTSGVAVRRLPAYYQAREFYAPRYESVKTKPDPRFSTLYWQPRVSVPASGRARISFYTADQGGRYRATLEGVAAGGQPVVGQVVLPVKAAAD